MVGAATSATLIHRDDSRLDHLRNHAGVTLPDLMPDHNLAIASLLSPATDVVQVYSFDGELDDQMRFESILLKWDQRTPLIVVCGKRVDGDDTLEEMMAVLRATLPSACEDAQGAGCFIKVITGLPLLLEGVDFDQASDIDQPLEQLGNLLADRPFIFHNNTSPTLLEQVLLRPISKQLKAVTWTCDLVLRGHLLTLGANAGWDEPAYLRALDICKDRKIPFISIHGSFQRFKAQTLAELEGWGDTMLRPAVHHESLQISQKFIRFGMAMPLCWAARVYGSTHDLDGTGLRGHLTNLLKPFSLLPDASNPRASDEWVHLAMLGFDDYEPISPEKAGLRMTSIATNVDVPLCNTVGDLSACTIDHCAINPSTIFLRIDLLVKVADHNWQIRIGDASSTSQHYVIAYADEEITLSKDWQQIQRGREARPAGTIPLLDEQLKQEWRAYTQILLALLEPALEKIDCFLPYQAAALRKAIANLRGGQMTRMCGSEPK